MKRFTWPRPTGVFFLSLSLILIVLTGVACGGQGSALYETVAPAAIRAGDAIPAPAGEVVLTVTGDISAENSDDGLAFDLATLEKLGLVKYTVPDPWLNADIEYSGVLLSDLLAAAGASESATTVHLTAIDDYQVDIAIADIKKWPVLLATQSNGNHMAIDAGGPTRIAFPYNQFPEIDQLSYKDFWIWSITRMEVR